MLNVCVLTGQAKILENKHILFYNLILTACDTVSSINSSLKNMLRNKKMPNQFIKPSNLNV